MWHYFLKVPAKLHKIPIAVAAGRGLQFGNILKSYLMKERQYAFIAGQNFLITKGIGISHLQNHIRTSCKELPPDIDRNSIFPKSVSSLDVRNFVLDPKLVRDFMTKFWITGNIAFRKIENVFSRE